MERNVLRLHTPYARTALIILRPTLLISTTRRVMNILTSTFKTSSAAAATAFDEIKSKAILFLFFFYPVS